MSISGGVDQSFGHGVETGCTAIQIFTKSNRQWKAKDLAADEIERFHLRRGETGIDPIITHASYLLNLATPDDELWEKSIDALLIELERCELLKIPYLVLHPGGHMKSGPEAGLARISAALDRVHAELPDHQVKVALEITAGQGTHLGARFEEIAAMIDGAADSRRLAVCFDTCHAFAAGYDFRTKEGYEAMMTKFDETIGLDRLAVMHINDSKSDLGSRVDRHTHLGEGTIGLEPFGFFVNDPRLDSLPFLLETPQDVKYESDKQNLAKLMSLRAD
jgi:deoxyribonuclease-4